MLLFTVIRLLLVFLCKLPLHRVERSIRFYFILRLFIYLSLCENEYDFSTFIFNSSYETTHLFYIPFSFWNFTTSVLLSESHLFRFPSRFLKISLHLFYVNEKKSFSLIILIKYLNRFDHSTKFIYTAEISLLSFHFSMKEKSSCFILLVFYLKRFI